MAQDNERGGELAGLGPADLLGLTPRSQINLAKFRLAYSPGVYAKAAEEGFHWPGTFLVGGKYIKRGLYGVAGRMPENRFGTGAGRLMKGAGGWLGGVDKTNEFLGPVSKDPYMLSYLDRQFRSGRLFGRGYGEAAKVLEAPSRLEAMRQAGIHYEAEAPWMRATEGQGYVRGKTGFYRKQMGPFRTIEGRPIYEAESYLDEAAAKRLISERIPFARMGKFQVAKYMGFRIGGAASTAMSAGLVFELASMVGYGSVVGASAIARKLNTSNYLDFGSGQFLAANTAAASTERQRALQAIQGHHLNARRFIGNEASLMHM